MDNKKIDFYEYGKKMANEFYDIQKGKAKEIEEKYGRAARRDFEIGIMEMMDIRSKDFINADLNEMFDENISGHKIETDDHERNNSYFGGTGVSINLDKDGFYNEPGKSRSK